MAAEHATEEPHTAANPVVPKIDATASPPGTRDSHSLAARNRPWVSCAW
ncbi:hypothetical protein ASALC70_02200 [Alcanivorax sp. ALC70]|nr:hypothetical protein ASALC70_02200 [Alcanivorax sp. ALC70]